MNYLAHLFLSDPDEDLMFGNFIADAVRGKQMELYSDGVRDGITHHRLIDDFTDHHPMWRQSKERLWDGYRHYGAVLVDLYYDHFLARNWLDFHTEPLEKFAERAYAMLMDRRAEMPERSRFMLPYMIKGNWLYNYQYFEGMQRVLTGMSRRAAPGNGMQRGLKELKEYYGDFKTDFLSFFPELIIYGNKQRELLRSQGDQS